jgi:molecular chaperone DnaJ
MINDSHFEILGITRHSTPDEIKKAYYKQIKKWHPDKFQHLPDKLSEAIETSKQINHAFR